MEAPARARPGEPVPLVFRVTNGAKASVTLQLLGRAPTTDFRVFDARGRMVWSRLRGETLLGALRLYPLDAGKELAFREVWHGHDDDGRPVPPGDYVIRAVLMTDDPTGLPSPPVRIRIDR